MIRFLSISFVFLLACFHMSIAQVVAYEPAFPTENDSMVVIFDATEGAGGLQDFDGDVYLHTGVITDKSSSGSDWKYVPFGWEVNDASVKATPLGNNKWKFTYKPSIREFFKVPAVEKIEKVAIVFKGVKNGSVVAEGKDDGGTDIFIDITEGEASSRFLNPVGDFEILDAGNSLEIVGVGSVTNGDLSLILQKNEEEIHTTTEDSIFYTFTPEAAENDIWFDLIATNGSNQSDTSSVFVTVKENNGELAARPSGIEDGITDEGASISLSLFAPFKDFVYVIGDFNNWTPSSEYLMNKETAGDDSTWFWIELDDIPAGEDITFQYLVDGEIRITDPYSELILDPWNDGYIEEETFPNIEAYPAGKTDGLVTWIRRNGDDYEWEVEDFERPDKENLVIYELLLRDFLAAHNYSMLIDTLDYLENLGINAIELMPINEFDGNLSWGYNPALHLALDKYYGSPEDFKRFVDAAHKRGIAVIVDLVLNHATGQNPLYKLYDHGENPYFNAEAKHAYNVFNDFNHQYSGTQHYVKRTVQYWIKEYNIDGFRWDLTKGFTQECTSNDEDCTGRPQQDRVKVLQKYADYQWEIDPGFYVIFEHLGMETEEVQWANYRVGEGKGILLWGNMNYSYNEATMGYNEGGKSNLFGVLAESRSSFINRHLVGYMESHDEERLMYKNLQYGNSAGNYDISELHEALNRVKLAAGFFLTLPGPKMIWQFGELGYDVSIDENGRTGSKPIRWNYFEDPHRKNLYKTFQALLKLRHSSEAFTDPQVFDHSLSGSLKWVKISHSDTDVMIVGNFGVETDTLELAFPSTGTWYNYFEGEEIEATDGKKDFILPPGKLEIYTSKQFDQPEEGILTHSEIDNSDALPSTFTLHQNYPNPFNPNTVISYQLAVNSKVSLEVFDMTGRKVSTLVNGSKPAGSYEVVFNAQNLASGVYIYRLTVGEKILTQKMTLIK